jgi:phosphomethylpyrimidine synthase
MLTTVIAMITTLIKEPGLGEQYHDQTLPAEGAKTGISARCAAPKFCSMKISAEVREFARLNPSPSGEGQLSETERGGGASPAPASESETEAGMAAMSRRFHDEGGEIYVPAAE